MNIIEQFYYGNLQPNEMMPKETREHKIALRVALECEEKLRQTLSDDGKKTLLQLLEAHDTLIAETSAEHFVRGYRLGVQMMSSCFE